MALMECAVCHRCIEAREAACCMECSAPLCPECERAGEGRCRACRDEAQRWR